MQLLGGYEKGKDYIVNDQYRRIVMGDGVSRHEVDHLMSIDMARSVCAHQQTENGRFYRRLLRPVPCETEAKQELMTFVFQSLYGMAVDANERSSQLEEDKAELQKQLSDAQNMLSYSRWVIDHPAAMTITRIAALYGWTPNQMNCWLEKQGIQYRSGKSWFLYPSHAKLGYTRTEHHSKRDSSGKVWPQVRQLWTQKGRMLIYEMMKKEGNLPWCEHDREDHEHV